MTKRTKTADIALTPPPPGHFLDATGRWVPATYLTERDQLRNMTVHDLVGRCRHASALLGALKRALFADLDTFVALVGEAYGVKLSGRNGSVVLHSLDGLERIERVVSPKMRVGPAILAAAALIEDLLAELTEGANPLLVQIAHMIVRRDDAGSIAPSRLLEFIRFDLPDARWQRAQAAARDALESDGNAIYFRAYTRPDACSPWEQIPLDFSRFGPAPAEAA